MTDSNERMTCIYAVPYKDRTPEDLFLEVELWLTGSALREESRAMMALRELLARAQHLQFITKVAGDVPAPTRTLEEILA